MTPLFPRPLPLVIKPERRKTWRPSRVQFSGIGELSLRNPAFLVGTLIAIAWAMGVLR